MANQNDETSHPATQHNTSKDQELHSIHSFLWRWNNEGFTEVTCSKPGTVEESLKKSAQFHKKAEKNKGRELVILRAGKAISPHFPCVLIQPGDQLTVKYVKAVEQPKIRVGAHVSICRPKRSSEFVMFHVLTKGGKNMTKIMRNPALKAIIHEITIYAYKGERVKQALKRDGRLLSTIFKKNFVLSNKSTAVKTELSNIVDKLNDVTFQLILLDKSSPPPSLHGSLEDTNLEPNESQGQSESENDNTPKQEPECNQITTPGNLLPEIPNSRATQAQLCSQFKEYVKDKIAKVPKLSRIQNLLRVDFGQNAQMCSEVKTMKTLMDLSEAVCQVRINGRPHGTGFLLFGSCVLTNGHVIKDIYNETRDQLTQRVSVHFSYESVDQSDGVLDVAELVCFECSPDDPGCDWALLKLEVNKIHAPALLQRSSFLPKEGGICIIGHPDGGVKKIDPCLIVPLHNRSKVVNGHCRGNQVINRHYRDNQGPVQFVTCSFFHNVKEAIHQKPVLTYESCFYHASSGSPVFDKHCNVVAMHSGGYVYRSLSGEPQSVIEFAHPLLTIIVRLIIHMVVRKKYDVLKEYLACSYDWHEIVMNDVKKLVENENLTDFINAVNDFLTVADLKDASLNKFFKFFRQKDEPIPMDIC
uniref:Protein FAM111A-like n=1 Tax=Fundulus heteroclitus TaxID=8078 RepID=A0A3Q2R2P0_FUNHE